MSKNTLKALRQREARKQLQYVASLKVEEVLKEYGTTLMGYDEDQVEASRDEFGANTLTANKKKPLWLRFLGCFVDPFSAVLLIIAGVSLITDVISAAPGQRNFSSVVIVLIMVGISGMMKFVQEGKSGRSAEKLSEMISTTATVARQPQAELPMDELVVGDVIYLSAGDMIPADVRILNAKDLFISQSSLTGESEPIEKFSAALSETNGEVIAMNNLAFMGTNVISGAGIALVVAIGNNTVVGSMTKSLSTKKIETNFEKGVNAVSWVLVRFMMIMVPIVFLVNGFTKGNWIEAFLFALSVAVGLTPGMLPMIVTTNLAKGAVQMSKESVIVKSLNSIQNFGAMDVLCTDKTGTLTQDKIVLEYSMNLQGEEDDRVLRHAFLNSYHQTGLKNLIDVAIIDHALDKDLSALWSTYYKVDEIPFDFKRRRMSVVVSDEYGKTQLITKGALEEMVSVCSFADIDGAVRPMSAEIEQRVLDLVKEYNEKGFRVIGVAQKTNPSPTTSFGVQDESDMVLIGCLAFLDPPKETAARAIKALVSHGIDVKVLTGDNEVVAKSVCKQVGIEINHILMGSEIEAMDDAQLKQVVEHVHLFAKLSPQQKVRVVSMLRKNGHTVGFMGDGINDAPALQQADVGISVDTAVDIAKESANIILLEKDLRVLDRGVIEGRKTYANIIKYIKMTASSNFGNMFSVVIASAFLPFLPLLPLQILILNLIYDISCTAIPWDNVDAEFLKKPRTWDASSVSKFMIWIGPSSSIFDVLTYLVMYFLICPFVMGGSFHSLNGAQQVVFIALFHAGWFVESLWTQTLVIHMLRTPKLPFIQSRASKILIFCTTMGMLIGTFLPYSPIASLIGMAPLPWMFFPVLGIIIVLYMFVVTFAKKRYVTKFKELL